MGLNNAPVSKQKQELKFKINLIFLPKFKKPAHCPNKNLRCYLFYTFSQNVVAHTMDQNNKVTKYFYQNHNNID